MSDDRRWSIGELAAAAGVTVRTLHHYEEIGLLPATERTGAGHRRYTAVDVRRLYQIKALRQLGLPLDRIGGALSGADDWRALLTDQLQELQRQSDHIGTLMTHVRGLLDKLDSPSLPDSQSFLTTIEAMSIFKTYLSEQRRDLLTERSARLGDAAIEAAQLEWQAMVGQVHDFLERGTPVSEPAVQQLVARWDALAAKFHGDDPQIKAAASRMWDENQAALSERAGWSATEGRDIVTYLRAARAYTCGQPRDTPANPPRPGGSSNT